MESFQKNERKKPKTRKNAFLVQKFSVAMQQMQNAKTILDQFTNLFQCCCFCMFNFGFSFISENGFKVTGWVAVCRKAIC